MYFGSRLPAILFLLLWSWTAAAADNDGTLDFSDRATPVCEVAGLRVMPPDGWFNVPIESEEAAIQGCQMMRARAGDDALVGIARVLSVQFTEIPKDPPWWELVVGMEARNINRMGYTLNDVIWSRDEVPIQGPHFTGAKAVGFSASIEDNTAEQEAHFLVFEQGNTKYISTLLTPAATVEEGVYFDRNTADFGSMIRAFTVPGE